jgi:outer membrane biosynthesis protein TonB
MPGWLWVVIAVVLAVAIYLLLRNRTAGGRHRTPAAETAPPLESGTTPVDAETGFGPAATAGLAGPAAAAVATQEEQGSAPEKEEREEEREEERAEDAELRHDEGYVETLRDPAPTTDAEREPEPKSEPEPPLEPEPQPAPEPEPDPEPEPERSPAPAAVTAVTPSEYGPGSSAPGPGGAAPQGWTVKGNADSMLYYTDDAPGFERAAADVWFDSEEAATAAGFTRWDAHHR